MIPGTAESATRRAPSPRRGDAHGLTRPQSKGTVGAIGEGRMTPGWPGRRDTGRRARERGAAYRPAAEHGAAVAVLVAGAGGSPCVRLPITLAVTAAPDRVIQGLVCGITGAIGYGLGVVAAWAWRAFADRDPRRTTHRSWRVFAVVSCVCLVAAMTFGRYWQDQIRMRMGVAPDGLSSLLVTPLARCTGLRRVDRLGRTLRGLYRWAARRLERWIGPRAAHAVGWTAVVVGTGLLVSGVVLDGLVAAADEAFSVRNGATEPGVVQPVVPQRSGSAESLVPWTSLGRQGRNFTGTGPTPEQIAAFTGSMANMPIRAYAGLDSAATAEQRARLAVEDLARAGGFSRRTLVVVTTTGSGWVDPGAVDSVEYMTGGDSATVSMQYSYLPSWMSYLVDQERAREAGRALFDAVYDRWSRLPMDNRPKLVVVGESLGSFGGETAFSGEYDLRNRTAGAIFAGPPNFNVLYREFVDGRDVGSPR